MSDLDDFFQELGILFEDIWRTVHSSILKKIYDSIKKVQLKCLQSTYMINIFENSVFISIKIYVKNAIFEEKKFTYCGRKVEGGISIFFVTSIAAGFFIWH